MSDTPKPKKVGGITGKGFVRGDSRINKKGRPRVRDIQQMLEEFGSQKTNPRVDKTRDEHFWQMVYGAACRGDMQAAKLYAAYRFGSPAQSIDLNANMTMLTPEQQVEQIEELLAAMPATADDEKSGDIRIN